MELKGAEIVVRTIKEQGVDTVFGYPGGTVLDIYDALYAHREDLRHVLVSHEQHAAHAADGYARATGKVGVCIATSGPGATNLVTGIATAFLDSVPLVAITGNVPTRQIGTDSFQEIDITGVTLPITKHNYFVGDIFELADTIREAFRLASSGRPGPVLVDIAKDVQQAVFEYEPPAPVAKDEPYRGNPEKIAAAAARINRAERPFVYFGGGVIASDAEAEVLELADKIDAPIGCSLMGISGVSTDAERFLGFEGMHGHFAASMAMKRADVIIALGARFNDRVTGNREKFAQDADIVHIDIDSSELSKIIPDAHGLAGDVKIVLRQLIEQLEKREHPVWAEYIAEMRERQAAHQDTREGLTPRSAMLALNERLEDETPIVTDVGQHQMWAAQHLRFTRPRTFITSGGLGTMGFGLGAAIGAAFGAGKRSVLVTGDGGLGMNLNELATAASYDVPVTIIVMNNHVLGMVRQWQNLFYGKRFSNTDFEGFRKNDFVAIAEAFGVPAKRVSSPEELKEAFESTFGQSGPVLIECEIGKDEFVLPMMPPGGTLDDIIEKVGE